MDNYQAFSVLILGIDLSYCSSIKMSQIFGPKLKYFLSHKKQFSLQAWWIEHYFEGCNVAPYSMVIHNFYFCPVKPAEKTTVHFEESLHLPTEELNENFLLPKLSLKQNVSSMEIIIQSLFELVTKTTYLLN